MPTYLCELVSGCQERRGAVQPVASPIDTKEVNGKMFPKHQRKSQLVKRNDLEIGEESS